MDKEEVTLAVCIIHKFLLESNNLITNFWTADGIDCGRLQWERVTLLQKSIERANVKLNETRFLLEMIAHLFELSKNSDRNLPSREDVIEWALPAPLGQPSSLTSESSKEDVFERACKLPIPVGRSFQLTAEDVVERAWKLQAPLGQLSPTTSESSKEDVFERASKLPVSVGQSLPLTEKSLKDIVERAWKPQAPLGQLSPTTSESSNEDVVERTWKLSAPLPSPLTSESSEEDITEIAWKLPAPLEDKQRSDQNVVRMLIDQMNARLHASSKIQNKITAYINTLNQIMLSSDKNDGAIAELICEMTLYQLERPKNGEFDVPKLLRILVVVCRAQGKLHEALNICDDIEIVRDNNIETDWQAFATILDNLAQLLEKRGMIWEARPLTKQACKIKEDNSFVQTLTVSMMIP